MLPPGSEYLFIICREKGHAIDGEKSNTMQYLYPHATQGIIFSILFRIGEKIRCI